MDTRQLEIFVAVAEELNFTRAAHRLYAVQSTVSAGIRALETELGTTLFHRSTRRVSLTSAGEVILPEARAVIDAVNRVRSAATESDAGLRGRIRIGSLTNLNVGYLADLLGTFHERYPLVDLALRVSPTGSTGLADDVRHGRLDIAFTGLPGAELSGLDVVNLASARYMVLLHNDDPLAGRETLGLAELADRRFIDTPKGFGNRVTLDRAFESEGLSRLVATEVGDLTMVQHLVAAGLGIAVIPDITPSTAAGVVHVPVVTPPLLWTMNAVTKKGVPLSPAVDALLELILATRTE